LQIFKELKRRNVFRVAVAYVIVGWLLLQVSDTLVPALHLPQWFQSGVALLLILGLPIALIFAWAFEMTPDGLKREHELDRSQSIAHHTGRKLDFAIFGVLVLALSYFAYDKFVLSAERDAALVEATKQAVTEQVFAEQKESTESVKSIAVLPFVNMSEDAGNEYFADGLSEELLNMLVKIPELRVAARTSSFSFKGKDLKISEIARELNVSHILEGSVRKSGNKVRITAQLIKADDGFHQWSENFDRTLDDIFVVQDEIASRVANALQVTMLGQSRGKREVDPGVYALWLKGLYFLNQSGKEDYKKSEEVLLQAIELEPSYANAWELLAFIYYEQGRKNYRAREEGYALAMSAIDRAMSLDPDQGEIQGAYGFMKKEIEWDWVTAQSAIAKAHQLEPNTNVIRIWRASMANTIGKLDDAVALYEQAILNDPLNLPVHSALGITYREVHRYDESIEIFEKQVELKPDYYWVYFNLGKSYLFNGDAEQAVVEIKKNPDNVFRSLGLVMAYSKLGRKAEAEDALRRLVDEFGAQNPVWIAEAYSWRGQKDEAFEWLEKGFMQRSSGLAHLLGNNVFYSLTDDPRWAELLKKIDLFEYWQAMPPEYGGPTIPPS
jgi:TolB-like protein/Tfp pilus assembly protein PilF